MGACQDRADHLALLHTRAQISTRSSIWTLYTAFVIFIYQLTTALLGMARSGQETGSAATLRQLVNFGVGALAWWVFCAAANL